MGNVKGTRAERELLHMLFEHGWMPLRAAGSGSTTLPAVDLVAGNGKKILAIECKSISKDRHYFDDEEIEQIKTFSEKFGADPIIGVRFDNIGWYFIELKDLVKGAGKNYFVSLESAQEKGFRFNDLIKKYK